MIARALRLIVGVALGWCVALAAAAPELTPVFAAAVVLCLVLSIWRPDAGLILITALVPAGLLLAPAPVRAAEILAWSFLAGWLLRVWRPLVDGQWPKAVILSALLFAAAALASWLTMTIDGASGISPTSLPRFVFRAIRADHLIFSSPESQTWTLLQTLAGIGVFLAALAITMTQPKVARGVGAALAASMATLSVATMVSFVQQWSTHEYAGWFLWQYVTSERFALNLADVNAAGSQYVLAGLTALGLGAFDTPRRWLWLLLLLVMVPGAWVTGSRSAGLVGAVIGALMLPAVAGWRWHARRTVLIGVATATIILLVAGGVMLAQGANAKGSAGRAMRLRGEFSETSAKMVRSAPVYGVGIGRYHARSNEFMPEELRTLYGFENAHNYFAQQAAELGLLGGALFLWFIVAPLKLAWFSTRTAERAAMGLLAGCTGYLVTCVTGHPLLVSEAALPFWIAFGTMTGASTAVGSGPGGGATQPSEATGHRGQIPSDHAWRWWTRAIAPVAVILLAVPVARAARSYTEPAMPDPQGFGDFEQAADGTRFQWTTRHGVGYVPAGSGFLLLKMRAPDVPHRRPFVVETEADGRLIDRRELPPGQWVTAEIPVRQRNALPYQRVDLRVNQAWTRQQPLGRRFTNEPLGIMLAEIRWLRAGS
ncbi:MAG: O-antigen ligase family protein [Vicinamibacterales bacterium]